MCVMCKEELLKGLSWVEIRKNGLEAMSAAQTLDELVHVIDRMKDLSERYQVDHKSKYDVSFKINKFNIETKAGEDE